MPTNNSPESLKTANDGCKKPPAIFNAYNSQSNFLQARKMILMIFDIEHVQIWHPTKFDEICLT